MRTQNTKTGAESPQRPFVYQAPYAPRATQCLDSCGDSVSEGDILQFDGTTNQVMPSQLIVVQWDVRESEWCFRTSRHPYTNRFGACGGIKYILQHCVKLGNRASNPELFSAFEQAQNRAV